MNAIELLKKYTGHDNIVLTPSGDSAIFAALYIARKMCLDAENKIINNTVLIPDQGGWLTYKKYPKMLELSPVEVKTDSGLLDLDDLRMWVQRKPCCLIYQNPAGYFADQDIKEIYSLCKGKTTVILDATGCIGDLSMCDGRYADIIVGSFGKWKPVNLGYGGFISVRDKKMFEKASEILNTIEFDHGREKELEKKLLNVKKRLKFLYDKAATVKKELEELGGYDVIHPERKGLNVIVRFKDADSRENIINHCKHRGYEYTICPRYIRVNEEAVSIELKRLED